jgi:hypothetical protein
MMGSTSATRKSELVWRFCGCSRLVGFDTLLTQHILPVPIIYEQPCPTRPRATAHCRSCKKKLRDRPSGLAAFLTLDIGPWQPFLCTVPPLSHVGRRRCVALHKAADSLLAGPVANVPRSQLSLSLLGGLCDMLASHED